MNDFIYYIYFNENEKSLCGNLEMINKPTNDFSKEMSVLSNHRDINTVRHLVDYAHTAEIKRGQ